MVTEFGRSAYAEPIVPEDEYFRRDQQIEALGDFLSRAARGETPGGLIEGFRATGKSDLIRRTILHLLQEDSSPFLIYYQIQPYTLELFDFACGYFNTLIRQYHYWRHGEAADLQRCVDAWHDRAPQCKSCTEPVLREICEAVGRAYVQRDVANTVSLLVSAPRYLMELQNQRCVAIVDQARYLGQIYYQRQVVPLVHQLAANLDARVAPLFLADSFVGLRTLLGEKAANDQRAVFNLARLDPLEGLAMLQTLCDQFGVGLSVRLAERMLPQLGGVPLYIHSLVRRAHLAGLGLDTTDHFGQVYAQEVRDGVTHWYWRAQFSTQFPQATDRQAAFEMCSYLAECHPQRAPLARLSERLSLEPPKLQQIIGQLQLMGVLDLSFGTVSLVDDPVLRDVVTVLAWGDNSATSNAELLRRLAARRVLGASTPTDQDRTVEFLGRLKRLLENFRGQCLPAEWFYYHEDYGAGWAGREGIRRSLGSSDTLVRLPYLMAISRMDIEASGRLAARAVVFCGSGFQNRQLTPGNETQWVVVVWPLADPVGLEHVNETEWLRSEVAKRTGREVSHTWLIGKATFTREARHLCSQMRFFTGNMDMVNYIHDQMFAESSPWGEIMTRSMSVPAMVVTEPAPSPAGPVAGELWGEMCLWAGNHPERLTTDTIEEVAQTAGFSLARIGQIKLAVLETVIHAAESSATPSDRIAVRYRVLPERLEVTVQFRDQSLTAQTMEPSRAGQADQPSPSREKPHMIHTLADGMAVKPVEDGIEIQLIFWRESPATSETEQRLQLARG